jgi:hypothetical protein
MQVALAILIGWAAEGFDDVVTYELLAVGVFDTDRPTTSQRSSLARAVRRLAAQGLVRIATDERDARRKLLRADPLILIAARLGRAGVEGTLLEINALLHELWGAGLIEQDGRFPGVPAEIQEIVIAAQGGPAPVPEISLAARELLTLVTKMMDFEEALGRAGTPLPRHILDAHRLVPKRGEPDSELPCEADAQMRLTPSDIHEGLGAMLNGDFRFRFA